jgi:hypothetical protein
VIVLSLTVLKMSCGCLVVVLFWWLSCGCLVVALWLSCGCLVLSYIRFVQDGGNVCV